MSTNHNNIFNILLLVAVLLNLASASYKVGKCPKLETTWNHTYEGQPLNHTKMLGVW